MGKRRSIYGDKLSDVRQQLIEAKYKTQNDIATYNSNITVDAWYKIWVETYKVGKIKSGSLKRIHAAYRAVIEPYIAHKKLFQVTQMDIQNIINSEHQRGIKTSSIKIFVGRISDMMKVACNNDLIVKNPCFNLTYPKQRF